jgi:hypothetical protein
MSRNDQRREPMANKIKDCATGPYAKQNSRPRYAREALFAKPEVDSGESATWRIFARLGKYVRADYVPSGVNAFVNGQLSPFAAFL